MRFDAATHSYWLGRRRVPSVTQVLAEACPGATAASAERGSWVHAAAAARDRGVLVADDEVPPLYRGYLDAHRAAMAHLRPHWLRVETPLYHPGLQLAGTPDRLGVLAGALTVVELKTGGPAAWHALQTAGYAWLATRVVRGHPARFTRLTVYLRPDGTFRVVHNADLADLDQFRLALPAPSPPYREEHDRCHPHGDHTRFLTGDAHMEKAEQANLQERVDQYRKVREQIREERNHADSGSP